MIELALMVSSFGKLPRLAYIGAGVSAILWLASYLLARA